MLRLMVNPANATTGEAVDKLMTIPRNGMARSASPKPTAARMKAQRNKIAAVTIMSVVVSTADIDLLCALYGALSPADGLAPHVRALSGTMPDMLVQAPSSAARRIALLCTDYTALC